MRITEAQTNHKSQDQAVSMRYMVITKTPTTQETQVATASIQRIVDSMTTVIKGILTIDSRTNSGMKK